MRHRLKKDFVLDGTLLALGDKVFLQKYKPAGGYEPGEEEEATSSTWDVYSFFTRQVIGKIDKQDLEEYFTPCPDDTTFPTERPKTKGGLGKLRKGLTILLLLGSLGAKAQEEHVKWSWGAVRVDSNVFMVKVEAWIEPGWYLPELFKLPDCELSPVVIDLKHNKSYREMERFSIVMATHKGMDKSCGINFYDETVIYTCPVKRIGHDSTTVKGIIVYQPFNYNHHNSLAPPRSKEFNITIQ